MILLEGVDLCGKTTVAKALRQSLPGWSYRGHTRPPLACGFSAFQYYSWFLADTHARVIVDRLHLSNCYQAVYDPANVMSDHDWKMVELACLKLKTRIIYMEDSAEHIKSRWRDDEMYVPDKVGELQAAFEVQLARTRLPVLRVNFRDLYHTGEVLIPSADIEMYMFEAVAACRLPSPSIGTGAAYGVMFIGESVNDNQIVKNYQGQLPFSHGPASTFLFEALELAQVPWYWGYYINADDIVNAEMLGSLLSKLMPQKVVGLGKKAEVLIKSGPYEQIDCSFVKHPQFAKRFGGPHEKAVMDYADQLSEAVGHNIDPKLVWGRP